MPRGVPKSGYRTRTMGLGRFVDGALTTTRPALLEGAVQHGGEALPSTCPKCHSEWLIRGAWEARCLCGLRFYRTVGVIRRRPTKEPA